jgi:hypothetical protein
VEVAKLAFTKSAVVAVTVRGRKSGEARVIVARPVSFGGV